MDYCKNKIKQLKKIDVIFLCLLLIYIVSSLWALLNSGYYNDDAINSQTKAYLALDHKSLFSFTYYYFHSWIKSEGRFFPFAWYLYYVFTYINSLLLYKILIMVFVCFNILSFGYLIKLITGNKSLSYIVMMILPVLFQFRIYHDPILSYQFLLQILFAYICYSLIFLQYYIDKKNKVYLFVSVLLYVFALLTYEITYIFFVLHVVIFLKNNSKLRKAIINCLPYIFSSALTIIISFYLRSKVQSISSGYTINLNLTIYFNTLCKQITAALPLNYFFYNPSKIFSYNINDLIKNITLNDFFTILIFVCAFYYFSKNFKEKIQYTFLISIGLILLIFPGVLISLATKHQQMLWGIGYLPVYIEYFGAALLIVCIYGWLLQRFRSNMYQKVVYIVFIVMFSIIALINMQNNRTVVETFNVNSYYPRYTFETSLKGHLLDGIPEGSKILLEDDTLWNNKYFIYLYTNRKYEVMNKSEFLKDYQLTHKGENNSINFFDLNNTNTYIIKYFSKEREKGYVFLGKVSNILINLGNESIPQICISDLKYFNLEGKKNSNSILCKSISVNGSTPFEKLIINRTDMVQMRVNPTNLYNIPIKGKYIEFNSLGLTDINEESFLDYNSASNQIPDVNALLFSSDQNSIFHSLFGNNKLVYDFSCNRFLGVNSTKQGIGLTSIISNFEGRNANSIIVNKKIDTGNEFSIETLLYPYDNKLKYATIISTHPGLNNYEGFVIQQNGTEDLNSYGFSFGNGTEWQKITPAISFKMVPNKWHYLVVIVQKELIKVYDNGKLVNESKYYGGLIKESDMPLIIGNWINNDRPFNGMIEEVCISKVARNDTFINSEWEKISKRIIK